MTARLVRELGVADEEELLRRLGADLRYLEPAYVGPKPERAADRLNRTSVLKAAIYLRGMDRIMMDLALFDEAGKCRY